MNKNILYIGPYREFSGAGNSARNYIQALLENGHDVCIAPIYYTGDIYPDNEISSEILPLENNYLTSYDISIQHCHPFDYVYSASFEQNIGIYQFNSGDIHPAITSRLELMDKIIVNSVCNYKAISKTCRTEISDKISIWPELIDHNLPKKSYTQYPWIKQTPKPIVFYTIGDFVERKNINILIKAFLYTFQDYDNVELVIKTKPHYSHNDLDVINKELEYHIDKIYKSLKINKKSGKQPKIMVGKFDYNYLLALHQNCNIYVDCSMAENFGYAVLEAALFGNYLIVNQNSSTAEISENAFLTSSTSKSIDDPYAMNCIENTTKRYWYEISFDSLCENMMNAYCLAITDPKTNHNLVKYSYEAIKALI